MKTVAAFALLFTACAASAGPTSAPVRHADAVDPGGVEAVKQVAQEMGDAMVAGNVDGLARIYSDDFVSIGFSGKTTNKQSLLTGFSSFHPKLLWYQLGPTDAQVFGRFAVSQGSVQEKRLHDGKETLGEYAWMDLLENRDGRWVVLRSAGAKISDGAAPRPTAQNPADAEALVKLAKRTGDAMVAFDVDALREIYADDWLTVRSDGSTFDKTKLLDDFATRRHQLVSFELGHMKVQVLGDVALQQASVTERRIHDGKDISGQFVFMDLLQRRAGKWVIVRTLGTRVG